MSNTDARMTFTEHLGELRTRIIRSAIAIAIGFAVAYIFRDYIFRAIKHPLDAAQVKWVAMNPFESFLVMLRLSLYGGIIMALPIILYQICSFVFPGLTPGEKRSVQVLLFGGLFLALGGIAIAYLGVFPMVMPYLLTFTPDGVDTQMRMGETVAQILVALLGFAIAFQFPILLLVLVYLELISPEALVRHWRLWMVGIAVVSAVFTPPDPFSLLFMTIPLWSLYWLSVVGARIIIRRKRSKELALK